MMIEMRLMREPCVRKKDKWKLARSEIIEIVLITRRLLSFLLREGFE